MGPGSLLSTAPACQRGMMGRRKWWPPAAVGSTSVASTTLSTPRRPMSSRLHTTWLPCTAPRPSGLVVRRCAGGASLSFLATHSFPSPRWTHTEKQPPAHPPEEKHAVSEAALCYEDAPPMPPSAAYVPPEQRSVDDESLGYLPDDHPMKKKFKAGESARRRRRLLALEEEERATAKEVEEEGEESLRHRFFSLSKRNTREEEQGRVRRAPELAAWRQGTDGGNLLDEGSGDRSIRAALQESIDGPPPFAAPPFSSRGLSRGEYDLEREMMEEASLQRGALHDPLRQSPVGSSSSWGAETPPAFDSRGDGVPKVKPELCTDDLFNEGEAAEFTRSPGAGMGKRQEPLSREEKEEGATRKPNKPPQITRTQKMELELQKLEYYYGTPQYADLFAAFQKQFAEELQGREKTQGARKYAEEEKRLGLENQPLDYLRSSKKLQMQLSQGPRAYDPITVLQRQGMMRFQGYAFPPSTVLGQLKGVDENSHLDGQWAAVDQKMRDGGRGPRAVVRRAFYSLLGREDPKQAHLAPSPSAPSVREDTSLAKRITGLDVTQRRQMRYMLTDFDYGDRQTSFHVMMTYPYTDWIHAFYMMSIGFLLYYLQLHFNAYDFYDEFLGLDLRQAPSTKKPFLGLLTAVIMVSLLFHPLLLASIMTTRAYRIIRRRPIGPP